MVVVCDMDPSHVDYYKETWPDTWRLKTAYGEYSYCGEKMNWAYERLPNAKFYGHLCDDITIETQDKLAELVESAGDWNIAYPNDGIYNGDLACFPVVGGKLARTWGFWAHPMFKHNCLDSVIDDIGRELGCLKFHKDIRFKVLHPYFGTAEWDDTYKRVMDINSKAGYLFDTQWRDSEARKMFMARVKREVAIGKG
jgi:hypothetical protein